MNLFENDNLLFEKLIKTYQKEGNLIIGVDFDDTIIDWDTGYVMRRVVNVLKRAKSKGCIICLYTCREDRELVEALDVCESIGLKIDYINSSPIILNTRKPLFNLLLDDKAGLVETTKLLENVLNEI